jgi:hypothetical protein
MYQIGECLIYQTSEGSFTGIVEDVCYKDDGEFIGYFVDSYCGLVSSDMVISEP